jgi:hypothetical protein
MGKPGEPYRPSNGTDGECFMAAYCYAGCRHFRKVPSLESHGCHKGIDLRAMAFATDDPGYPREWTYDATGKPTCTAFDDSPSAPRRCHKPAKGQASMFSWTYDATGKSEGE